MADLRRFGLVDFLLLLLTLALAGGARSYYLISCCDKGATPGPLRVQDVRTPLDQIGGVQVVASPAGAGAGGGAAPRPRRNAEDGHIKKLAGYGGVTDLDEIVRKFRTANKYESRTPVNPRSDDTAYTSPGYPLIVGLLARVLPDEKLETTIRWGQCGLGTLTAALYFLFARRAFGSRFVATLAGILCAYLAVVFEREEVLSNIVCNRPKKTQVSVGLFTFIASPFVALAAAIALIGVPGVVDWAGGLFVMLRSLGFHP